MSRRPQETRRREAPTGTEKNFPAASPSAAPRETPDATPPHGKARPGSPLLSTALDFPEREAGAASERRAIVRFLQGKATHYRGGKLTTVADILSAIAIQVDTSAHHMAMQARPAGESIIDGLARIERPPAPAPSEPFRKG